MTTATAEKKTRADISTWMTGYLAKKLNVASTAVDPGRTFGDYGIDSAVALQMVGDLEDYLGHKLSPSLPYKYPTIAALSEALANEQTK